MSEQHPGNRDYLLTPVLESEQMPVPAYSTGAHFFTAFFGGPFAIILFSALNAAHMGRLQKDAWRYLLATIVSFAAIMWVVSASLSISPPAWMLSLFDGETSRAIRWGGRAFGLVVWLALWLPYRRYYKAAEIMGVEPKNPWGPAIACVAAAIAVQFVVVSAMSAL